MRQRFDLIVNNDGYPPKRFRWQIEMEGSLDEDPLEAAIDFLKHASRTLALIRENPKEQEN